MKLKLYDEVHTANLAAVNLTLCRGESSQTCGEKMPKRKKRERERDWLTSESAQRAQRIAFACKLYLANCGRTNRRARWRLLESPLANLWCSPTQAAACRLIGEEEGREFKPLNKRLNILSDLHFKLFCLGSSKKILLNEFFVFNFYF